MNFPGSWRFRRTSIWTPRFCRPNHRHGPELVWRENWDQQPLYYYNIFIIYILYVYIYMYVMEYNGNYHGFRFWFFTKSHCFQRRFPVMISVEMGPSHPVIIFLTHFFSGKMAELDHSGGCGCCELWASLVLPAQCCQQEWADPLQTIQLHGYQV